MLEPVCFQRLCTASGPRRGTEADFSSRFTWRRLTLALQLLLLLAIPVTAMGQSLRFVPVSYTVQSLHTLLNNPQEIAVDPDGNVYVADTANSKVWKMDPTQSVEVYAGNGTVAFTGDNGPAVAAGLSSPTAVATDLAGNLYIADMGNYAIRRVDASTGIITTIAGGNGSGTTGDGGPATAAKFQKVSGLAVDAAGNIYVSDATAGVVRQISTNGIISTVAGGGSPVSGNGDGGAATGATLQSPWGLAIDSTGALYIAESGTGRVRKVAQGVISTFAGSTVGFSIGGIGAGGPATSAKLGSPRGVAVDSAGSVYIADSSLGAVAVVDPTGTINVLAGLGVYGGVVEGGPASEVGLSSIYGVGVDSFGNVFLSSSTQNDVYEVVLHPERFPMTKLGSSSAPMRLVLENVGAADIALSGITFAGDFSLGTNSNQSLYYSPCKSTTTITTGFGNFCTLDVVFTPTAVGVRTSPLSITSNDTPSTTTVSLSSTGISSAVVTSGGQIFTVAGLYPGDPNNRGDNVPALQATLNQINGLVTDSAGNIFLTEYGYCQIRKVDATTGIISTFAGIKPDACNSVSGPNGDGGPATQATLYAPGALAFGSDGTLYISDAGHNKIRTINSQGIISTFAGTGSNICAYQGDGTLASNTAICGPQGIAIDRQNNLYFTDPENQAIFKISSSGIFSKVAGLFNNFVGGYSGDGGPALNALLNRPWGIVVDAAGNIYFCDSGNDVVRKIDVATGTITTVAGIPMVSGFSGDGGPATQAKLNTNYGLAIDSAGNLYIADSGNYVIRKVELATGVITTVVGSYEAKGLYNGDGLPATEAGINYPSNAFIDNSGYLLVGDRNNLVRKVDPNGSIHFASQAVNTTSAAQTLTISNIGNSPLHFDSTTSYSIQGDFALTSGGTCDFTQPLNPGSSCTLLITFTPTASYSRYGALALFTDGVVSPQLTQLEGVGAASTTPQAVLSPTSVTFPNQTVNTTSSPVSVTLSNPGGGVLNISNITVTGGDAGNFSETTTCGSTLAASGQCTISVTFTPNATRAFSATIMLQDDAGNSPQSVTLTGTGVAAQSHSATLSPASIDFGSQAPGSTSAVQSLTLTNTGGAVLNISSVTLTGVNANAFSLANACGATLATGANCSIAVTFTPPSIGRFSANVTVADDATGTPQTATLVGTGTTASTYLATLSPSSASFGSVAVNTTSPAQTFTLSNTGNSAVSISNVTITGANASAFTLTNSCGSSLAAGAQCSMTVTFTPSSSGQFSAGLSVLDNANGSPQIASLSGTGSSPDFSTSSPTPGEAVNAGESATYQIKVTPLNGNFNLPVTLSASGLPSGATVTFTPAVVTPGVSGATSTMVVQTAGHAIVAVGNTSTGRMPSPGRHGLPIVSTIVAAGLLCLRRFPRLSCTKRLWTLLLGAALLSLGLSGCGGGFARPSSSSSQSYTITVTGTNGTDQHSTTVTLTIR